MVAIYCTYLTMSAVSMEPDSQHCNPLIRAQGTRTASTVLGAIVTMLTIAYTTTRAATQGVALSSNSGHATPKSVTKSPSTDWSTRNLQPAKPFARKRCAQQSKPAACPPTR